MSSVCSKYPKIPFILYIKFCFGFWLHQNFIDLQFILFEPIIHMVHNDFRTHVLFSKIN